LLTRLRVLARILESLSLAYDERLSRRRLFAATAACVPSPPLRYNPISMTFEQALKSVWRQALVDGSDRIDLAGTEYPVRGTSPSGLRQIDFTFEGRELRAIEQNPKTKSRWAQLARAGKRVMQFLEGGRYVAVVVDGRVIRYGSSKTK
jgi:hypothetical protein